MEVTTVKRLLLVFVLLMLLPLCAQAVTTVPAHITDIEDEAFAGTAIDALIIPATVETVGKSILKGGRAAYILAEGSETSFAAGASSGVPYVFAPAGSDAVSLPGYRALSNLRQVDGLYYFVLNEAEPLCAVDPAALTGTVTVPKLVEGLPVTSLNGLYLKNAGHAELRVPLYLTIPEGLTATPYATMTVLPPATETTQAQAGHNVTWTTGVEGAYGDVTYLWSFTTGGEAVTRTTFEPTITYAHMEEGELQVSVTATDALGDHATAQAEAALPLSPLQTVYRALLIGNTYPGAINSLPGPDNDLFSMLTVLNSMNGTPFTTRSAQNLTAGGMQAAIATTFAGAQPSDVSLLYYSGHGESNGALVGVNNTYLSVYGLRAALQKIPGTKIVILDCCYSGNVIARSATAEEPNPAAFNRAVISGLTARSRSSENLEDEGYVVITACRKDQRSNTMSDPSNGSFFGVFTYGLCYGSGYDEWQRVILSNMPADADGNRAIALGEAIAGVKEREAFLKNMLPSLDQDVQYHGDPNFILWAK